jgi:hypothetical protein
MRRIIRTVLSIAAALAIPASATSALAYDLSGLWEGTYKCKGFINGVKDKYEDFLQAAITQSGTAVGANISFDGDPFRFNGLGIATSGKPDKGDLVLVVCGTNDNLTTQDYDEIGRMTVTTKPSKGTGSIKGVSNYAFGGTDIYTCKWKLKRVSAVDPQVGTGCTM